MCLVDLPCRCHCRCRAPPIMHTATLRHACAGSSDVALSVESTAPRVVGEDISLSSPLSLSLSLSLVLSPGYWVSYAATAVCSSCTVTESHGALSP